MKRELWDVLDLKLVLMDLNKQGLDLEIRTEDAHRLHVTCKRTQIRFVIQEIGHNDWPDHLSA
jgi:hypothetical protein